MRFSFYGRHNRKKIQDLFGAQLRSYLAALVRGAVHVDIEIFGQIALVLGIGELRSRRNGPSVIGAFGKRYNHRTEVLT